MLLKDFRYITALEFPPQYSAFSASSLFAKDARKSIPFPSDYTILTCLMHQYCIVRRNWTRIKCQTILSTANEISMFLKEYLKHCWRGCTIYFFAFTHSKELCCLLSLPLFPSTQVSPSICCIFLFFFFFRGNKLKRKLGVVFSPVTYTAVLQTRPCCVQLPIFLGRTSCEFRADTLRMPHVTVTLVLIQWHFKRGEKSVCRVRNSGYK